MSGYNSRTKFDSDFYNELINEQTQQGYYRLDPNYSENNIKCHSLFGPRQNNNRSNSEVNLYNFSDRKEIENYLKNLDMSYSRTTNMRTLDEKNNKLNELLKNKQINTFNQCDNLLDNNNTRLNNDILDLKSININRYEYPIVNPLNQVFNGISNTEQINNNRNGLNSRLEAKNNYKLNK
jgi:hypothetical protein